jgi:VIT1/CCC1 family predicted Fe2+/Mn2+ transporter
MEAEEENVFDMFKTSLSSVSQMLISGVVLKVSEQAHGIMEQVEDQAKTIQDNVMKTILSSLSMAAAAFFFLFSFLFFMIEYLEVPVTISFFVVGLIVLVIGFIIRSTKR